MSSGRGNSAFALWLLIIMAVVPVYALAQSSTHPSTTKQESAFGDFKPQSVTVAVASVNHNGASLNVTAVIHNPSGFGATLDEANYSVYSNGVFLGSGQTDHEYTLAPQSTVSLSFPISISWKSLFHAAGSYVLHLGSTTWEVRGTAEVSVGGLPLVVPFDLVTG